MKIAYFLSHDITRNDGVTLKISTQVEEWKALGHDVEVYCQIPNVGDSLLSANQYAIGSSYIKNRLTVNHSLVSDMKRFSPDVVYFRYDTFSASLREIFQSFSVVTEINTNDLHEYWGLFKKEKSVKSLMRFMAYFAFRDRVFKNVIGIVGVTQELVLNKNIAKYRKPTLAVSNSIDVNQYPRLKDEKANSNGIFFIGTPNQPWHGVDLIEELAGKLKQYHFHVVGLEGNSTSNLSYHGYLGRKDYQAILRTCCICIGSLAMYRNEMYESNSLKVREYIAAGFPVLLGCPDSAFISLELPNWMKVIDTREELNVKDIEQFIESNRNIVVPEADKQPISSEYNERKRLMFIHDTLNSKGNSYNGDSV